MQLDIKTKDIELTDAIRAAVEERMAKLDKIVARFGESVTAEVEVGKTTGHHAKGPFFRAEVHVRLPNKLVYADAENEDLYMAVREARDRAKRQILDYKDTMQDSHKGGPPDIGAEMPTEDTEQL
ncbi:ribosome hibernation-promoting factor, HPF/YfiA family [Patescibacteria group bacterium]